MKNKLNILIISFVLLIVAGFGIYFYKSNNYASTSNVIDNQSNQSETEYIEEKPAGDNGYCDGSLAVCRNFKSPLACSSVSGCRWNDFSSNSCTISVGGGKKYYASGEHVTISLSNGTNARKSSGPCSVSGTTATCSGDGWCRIVADYSHGSGTCSTQVCCTSSWNGPTHTCNLPESIVGHSRSWADNNASCVAYEMTSYDTEHEGKYCADVYKRGGGC
jgi:hypothetical protein